MKVRGSQRVLSVLFEIDPYLPSPEWLTLHTRQASYMGLPAATLVLVLGQCALHGAAQAQEPAKSRLVTVAPEAVLENGNDDMSSSGTTRQPADLSLAAAPCYFSRPSNC